MVEASGGNSDNLQSVLTTQARENLAGTEARQATAAGMGLTAPEMRRDREAWDSLQAYERNRALEAGADALGMKHHDFVKAVNRNGLVSVTLSPEQLRAAHEKNPLAIPEATFKIFEQTGARLQSGITNHGNLVDVLLSANTTASTITALDNSLNLGNPVSARSTLTDPFMVEKILATKGEDALVQASADSLKGIVNMTHQNNTHAGVSAGAKVGASLGVMGGSAGGSLGKNWSDQTVTDALYGNSRSLLKALKVEAQQGIAPRAQDRWVSEHYAKAMAEVQSYYMQDSTKDSVSASSAWEGAKEMVGKIKEGNLSATNPFEQYLKKQNFEKGQEAFKASSNTKESKK